MAERCRATVLYKVIRQNAGYIDDGFGRKVKITDPDALDEYEKKHFLIADTTMEVTIDCSFCEFDSARIKIRAFGKSRNDAFKNTAAEVREYLREKCPVGKKF